MFAPKTVKTVKTGDALSPRAWCWNTRRPELARIVTEARVSRARQWTTNAQCQEFPQYKARCANSSVAIRLWADQPDVGQCMPGAGLSCTSCREGPAWYANLPAVTGKTRRSLSNVGSWALPHWSGVLTEIDGRQIQNRAEFGLQWICGGGPDPPLPSFAAPPTPASIWAHRVVFSPGFGSGLGPARHSGPEWGLPPQSILDGSPVRCYTRFRWR